MLTVIIKDDGEPKVLELTYKNLWRELKDMPEAELMVSNDWFKALSKVKTTYVCFVEADCLVSSGYFSSMMGLYKKSRMLRKLAMLSPSTAVNSWANKFYGYSIDKQWSDETSDKVSTLNPFVQPNKEMKSRGVYPVQIGYVPGSIIRLATLKDLLKDIEINNSNGDLMLLSTMISLGFWGQGDGNRVHINPNATYVTTEDYVNDLGQFDISLAGNLAEKFRMESIS